MRQQLSSHFRRSELVCFCCGELKLSRRLVDALEKLRHKCGNVPIHVRSGYRCPEWNERVGGVPGSKHLSGEAADIVVEGLEPVEVAEMAETVAEIRHGGIGVYSTFVHVDVRQDGAARWKG